MRSALAVVLSMAMLTGCAVGPNYKRPQVQVPTQYRRPTPNAAVPEKTALSDLAWASLFRDDVITELVRKALTQSNDLEAATQRVLEARAQLGITRSQIAPNVSASAGFTAARTSSIGSFNFIPPGTQSGDQLHSGRIEPVVGA